MDSRPLIKYPSGWLPIAMSLAALGLVLYHALFVGDVQQPDEGTAAHIYQLLMTVQMPIVAYFLIRWVPRRWKQGLLVLALQGLAWMAALGVLFWAESR
jgi:hypothetical protein